MAKAGTKVGAGYVSIEPDFDGFQQAIERGIKSRFQKIGDDAGRTLTESVSKRVRRDRSDFGLAASLTPITKRFEKTGREASEALAKGFQSVERGRANAVSMTDALKDLDKQWSKAAGGVKHGGLAKAINSDKRSSLRDIGEMEGALSRIEGQWRDLLGGRHPGFGKALAGAKRDLALKDYARDLHSIADLQKEIKRRAPLMPEPTAGMPDMFGINRELKALGSNLRSSSSRLDDWGNEARDSARGTQRLAGYLRGLGSRFRESGREARSASGGFGSFNGGMARVNRSAQFFRNILRLIKWPVLIAGVGLFAQGLSALAAGFVATASAIGPLAGGLVALPALALAGAQAFSVLKLATAGVGDALKAALDAEVKGGGQAVDTLRQQEAASERVADAKRNLSDVQRQARLSQEDLTEARQAATRELEDMRLASERSHDSEQGGRLSLIQARKELAETLRDPAASGLDIRFAEEAVDQAKSDLEQTRIDAKRARQDYADAKRKGVEGMPEVVAAKRAEEDANRAVADAQRDLVKAVRENSDAMKEQGDATNALQEKMSQLPKAGQKFVRFLVGLKPRLDALRDTAASGFFPGAEKGMRSSLRNFGVLLGLVDGTSKSLGRLASKAGRKLGSDVWGKDLGRLGKLNERIIGRLGDSTLNLADSFRNVLVSAEPFLDWLSKGTEKFSEFLKVESAAGRESGSIAAFFDRTRQTMERLFPILKGVGGGLLSVGDAADDMGNEILVALGDSAEGWRKWTDSTAGQNKLKRYFTETKPAIFEMGRLLRDAGKAFFELGKQDGVPELLRLVRTELIPALRDMTGGITGWAARFIREFSGLRKEGVPVFDAFVRTLVNHAGEAGVKIAGAIGRAFIHASIWGKLAIAGWLFAKFGGFRAFAEMGAKAGARLGKALFKAAAKWIAGTEAGSSLLGWFQGAFGKGGRFSRAASTAGSRLGRTFARGMTLGAIAGMVLLAPTIRDAVDKYILNPVDEMLKNVFGDKVSSILADARNLIDPANLGPVPTLLGIDAKGFVKGKIQQLVAPEPDTRKAVQGFERFRKRVNLEGERTREGFRGQLQRVPDIAGAAGQGAVNQMLPRLNALTDVGKRKSEEFKNKVGGQFTGLAKISIEAMESIGISVSNLLDAMNLKKPKGFNVQKALKEMPELKSLPGNQSGGYVRKALASGGLAAKVPGNSAGDRHLLSLNGQPVAKVESREGIFVGNRNYMAALESGNKEVPRFQKGGMAKRAGGLVEPNIAGPDGPLRRIGQEAVQKVYEGAKSVLANAKGAMGGFLSGGSGSVLKQMGRILLGRGLDVVSSAGVAGNSYQESGWDPEAMEAGTDNGGLFGFTAGEKSMAALRAYAARIKRPWNDVSTQVNFMLTSLPQSMRNAMNRMSSITDTTAFFMNEWERPNAALANLPRRLQGAQKALTVFSGLGGLKGMKKGGVLQGAVQRLAGGGMVDVPGDGGSGVINPSIVDLVAAYCKKFDTQVNYGYDPSGHVSPGHLTTGTATDTSPRSGNWTGLFEDGLRLLVSEGFEVGYGTDGIGEAWPNHGRGNHAHTEWVGNGTAPDARQRLRNALGSPSGSGDEGPAAAPREKIPATYKGAKTGALDFGAMPKNLDGVNKQLSRWEKEVGVYRRAKAEAAKAGRPGLAHAIAVNLEKIESRIASLRNLRTRLRLEETKKAIRKRLNKAFGRFGNYEQIIEGSQRSYEGANQFAEQVVATEPLSPELGPDATDAQRADAEKAYVENFKGYVEGQERPAFGAVVERLADWRNNILRAERFGFKKGESGFNANAPSVLASSSAWEKIVRGARSRIDHIKVFSEKVDDRVAEFKRKNPKAKELPDGLKKQVAEANEMKKELPGLRLKDGQFTGAVGKARELFFEEAKSRIKPPPIPLPWSGTLEDALTEVQGLHPDLFSHGLLGASDLAGPPTPGRFGGIIWDLQETLKGLGLKVQQAVSGLSGAGGSSEDDSELTELERTLRLQAQQRFAVSERQRNTIGEFLEDYPFPRFHQGGVFPGPRAQEGFALLQGQERIRTPEQEIEMAEAVRGIGSQGSGGDLVIERLVVHTDDGTVEAWVNGRRQEVRALVKEEVRSQSTSRQLGSTNLR